MLSDTSQRLLSGNLPPIERVCPLRVLLLDLDFPIQMWAVRRLFGAQETHAFADVTNEAGVNRRAGCEVSRCVPFPILKPVPRFAFLPGMAGHSSRLESRSFQYVTVEFF